MSKTLVGPQLRQLRQQMNHTQAEMARRLGISAAYVNLLENNQRSLSVPVLMKLTEAYGVDWRALVQDTDAAQLADLRSIMRDPVFVGARPDLTELRAAIDHAPRLVERFLQLYQNHRAMVDQLKRLPGTAGNLTLTTPETAIHDFFRNHGNHFDVLERAAEALRDRIGGSADDMYASLKRHLRVEHGVQASVRSLSEMPDMLRDFDAGARRIFLSEALDHTNRVFQLAHMIGLLEAGDIVADLVARSGLDDGKGGARLRVELTNYFAAAMLMPYAPLLEMAQASAYDIDRIAAAFGVSFEQVCHRLTTLQRDGARGVPFFFLRVDRAGNVTKRFNATGFTLAEEGGACPVWDLHGAFRVPGLIVPQFVELPDGGQFFTISRTTDRPVFSRQTQDRRLVVTIGCTRDHADQIGYARPYNLTDPQLYSPIGLNCHVCPRHSCSQRAHQPLHMHLPLDANRRGQTRYES